MDSDGNIDIDKTNSNGDASEVINSSSNKKDSLGIYIVYNKQKLTDQDVIFLPLNIKKKITLKAVAENDTTQSQTFSWKGVDSYKDDKATILLDRPTKKKAKKVELIYGKKKITISLNIVGAYFKRLKDGNMGKKNIYGYDEMDQSDPDDDHISVETNGTTFVDLKTSMNNLEGIFLQSDDNQVVEAVVDGDKVKIIGKNSNKQQTIIKAYTVNDSSTAIASITVNVYNKVKVNGKIYNVYLSGNSSTKITNNMSANAVKKQTNEHLKYLVVEMDELNSGIEIPMAYDLNDNKKLDYYKNDKNHELNIVYKNLRTKNLKFNDIVRFKEGFTRNWTIMDSVRKGDTYILVKNPSSKPMNKGFDVNTPFGEYTLQSPQGDNAEVFQITGFNGDTVFITTSATKSKIKGFLYNHPKTTSLKTSHVIISESKTVGLGPSEGIVDKSYDDRPALICGITSIKSIGERVAHELMHGQGLRDVNDNTNIMHFETRINISKLPFRFKVLDPVVTGTSTLDNTKPKQNQWEIIKR